MTREEMEKKMLRDKTNWFSKTDTKYTTKKIAYKSGWKSGYRYASTRITELEAQIESLKQGRRGIYDK